MGRPTADATSVLTVALPIATPEEAATGVSPGAARTSGGMTLDRRMAVGAIAAAAIVVGVAIWARHQAPLDLSGAIRRGEAYLRTRQEQIDPTLLLVLDFLARRYDVGWMDEAAARVRTAGAPTPCAGGEAGCERPPVLASIRRLVDPSVRVTAAELQALAETPGNTLDSFTFRALHCRTVPLSGDYPQHIAAWLDPSRDFHDPPHAALALQWAIEQGCLDAAAAPIARLREQAIEQLVRVADGVPRDQPIEAVAMLGYLGARDRVQRGWLETIVAAQREDGGWGEAADQPSNDHTTILALWVLLEQTRPARAVPWVPPPPSAERTGATS